MKLSSSERETLIGPACVGAVVGLLIALSIIGFNSEYKHTAWYHWSTLSEAMLGLLGGFCLAFIPFGLAPVLVTRALCWLGKQRR